MGLPHIRRPEHIDYRLGRSLQCILHRFLYLPSPVSVLVHTFCLLFLIISYDYEVKGKMFWKHSTEFIQGQATMAPSEQPGSLLLKGIPHSSCCCLYNLRASNMQVQVLPLHVSCSLMCVHSQLPALISPSGNNHPTRHSPSHSSSRPLCLSPPSSLSSVLDGNTGYNLV